jgi:hypothetical protein
MVRPRLFTPNGLISWRFEEETPVSNHARKTLPAPQPSILSASAGRQTDHPHADIALFEPMDLPLGDSPTHGLQRQLYRHYNIERYPPVQAPYPMPVRVALLAGCSLASWAALYSLAHVLLQAIH